MTIAYIGGRQNIGTLNNSWTVNLDNSTADTEDSSLQLSRGSEAPPATLTWDSTAKEFRLNFPLRVDGDIHSSSINMSELVKIVELASNLPGKGASMVGVEDPEGWTSASNVEEWLAENSRLIAELQAAVHSGVEIVYHTVTALEAANKQIVLDKLPADLNSFLLFTPTGPQERGSSYILTGKTVAWGGYTLDAVPVSAGDVFGFVYVYGNNYPTDVNIKYHKLTVSDISNKYVQVFSTPADVLKFLLIAPTGPQVLDTDYYIDGMFIKWDGLQLEDDLKIDDSIGIIFLA